MKEKPKFQLKPIERKEFEKLSPRRTYYHDIVEKFLSSNHDIMELLLEGTKPQTAYQSLKSHSQRLGYPFLVRRKEKRVFLLKRRNDEKVLKGENKSESMS